MQVNFKFIGVFIFMNAILFFNMCFAENFPVRHYHEIKDLKNIPQNISYFTKNINVEQRQEDIERLSNKFKEDFFLFGMIIKIIQMKKRALCVLIYRNIKTVLQKIIYYGQKII